jgi:hypothetical protein
MSVGFLDYLDAYCLLINGMKQAVRSGLDRNTCLRAVDSETGEAHSFSVAKPFTLQRNIERPAIASTQTFLTI